MFEKLKKEKIRDAKGELAALKCAVFDILMASDSKQIELDLLEQQKIVLLKKIKETERA